jgi:predicted extracellular nuclease
MINAHFDAAASTHAPRNPVATHPGRASSSPRGHATAVARAGVAIHDIQGSGAASPLDGMAGVVIEGVVVGDYQQSGGLGGFFVQEEDADAARADCGGPRGGTAARG